MMTFWRCDGFSVRVQTEARGPLASFATSRLIWPASRFESSKLLSRMFMSSGGYVSYVVLKWLLVLAPAPAGVLASMARYVAAPPTLGCSSRMLA